MKESIALDAATVVRRAIFVVLLISIAMFQVLFTFKGLTHRTGIDQAQVAREVARGNGLSTKFVRPLAIQQLQDADKPVNLEHMFDTYHSPLNILVYAGVIKMVGGDDAANYAMADNDKVYKLDRVIAFTCAIFFLVAIGINYLLVSRIFDHKIGSVVAIVMMVSEYLWGLTQSGLPQMLMLTLFSAALYMAWRAVELQEAKGSPFLPAVISGFFFGLLALAHWMTLWIFIGYVIFAAVYFRPRGAVAATMVGLMLLFIAAPLIFYLNHSDGLFGTAFYAVHGGSGASEDVIMRDLETRGLDVRGILLGIAQNTLVQASNVQTYLGGLIIAPAFFLALLHPFKRSSIATFRWAILLMWVFAAIGMSLYGVSNKVVDPNQLHILFLPIMTGYAMAMVSIVWARVPLSQQSGLLGNLHFAVIILITASPMLLTLRELSTKRQATDAISGVNVLSLNNRLAKFTDERSLIISDQPWAVAWYADRHAIWLPRTFEQLEAIEEIANQQENPIAGLHFSYESYKHGDVRSTFLKNQDFSALIYSDWMQLFTQSRTSSVALLNPIANSLVHPEEGRYKYAARLVNFLEPAMYYSRENLLIEE